MLELLRRPSQLKSALGPFLVSQCEWFLQQTSAFDTQITRLISNDRDDRQPLCSCSFLEHEVPSHHRNPRITERLENLVSTVFYLAPFHFACVSSNSNERLQECIGNPVIVYINGLLFGPESAPVSMLELPPSPLESRSQRSVQMVIAFSV
jgi:hypothetical protein